VSYESEDRYWTDYLRVALPVIGLLLMLALFWWWAQQFIGDENDPDDLALSTQTIVATVAAPTPTDTVEPVINPTQGEDNSTPDDNNNGGQDDGVETPDDGQQACGFEQGDIVVVTEDDVRLREEPVVDPDNVSETLSAGAQLSIIADCYEEDDEGNQFWRVRNQETSQTGYVAGQFLAAEGDEE
jgi:hypothetical protein